MPESCLTRATLCDTVCGIISVYLLGCSGVSLLNLPRQLSTVPLISNCLRIFHMCRLHFPSAMSSNLVWESGFYLMVFVVEILK